MSRHAPSVLEAFDTFCAIVDRDKSIPVEERMKHALAEILAPKHELLRRRAETIAQPIAERHGVTVAAIFGPRRQRHITAARDALCAELVAREWTHTDIGRVLGIGRTSAMRAAVRGVRAERANVSERKAATR
jgi:chromosomal replication initiation ATPase DnaA